MSEDQAGHDIGRSAVDDGVAEALLAGQRTNREELASLERFLHEVRTPVRIPTPQPSAELTQLFTQGRSVGAPALMPPLATPSVDIPQAAPVARRKPVRKMAKVAAIATTAAMAVTLAAAAQVLPKGRTTTTVAVSGPATPIQIGAGQNATVGAPGAKVEAGGQADVGPSTTVAGRTGTTIRSVGGTDVSTLSPEALARLPIDVLKRLPGDALARLPIDVLRTLPGEALMRLPVDVLKTLPGDALARLPADALRTLPADALARLPLDVLKTLPEDALVRLPAEVLRTLPGETLARLPFDVLRLLLLSPTTTVTTATVTTATTATPRS